MTAFPVNYIQNKNFNIFTLSTDSFWRRAETFNGIFFLEKFALKHFHHSPGITVQQEAVCMIMAHIPRTGINDTNVTDLGKKWNIFCNY